MTRVLRQDNPVPLEVPETHCVYCGDETRDGRCGRRCHASKRADEAKDLGRVDRLDIEET